MNDQKWPQMDAEQVCRGLLTCTDGENGDCSDCPMAACGDGCQAELMRQAARVIRDLKNATLDVADREILELRRLAMQMNGPEGQGSDRVNGECFHGINQAIGRLGKLQRGCQVLMTPVDDRWMVEYIQVGGVDIYRREASDG